MTARAADARHAFTGNQLRERPPTSLRSGAAFTAFDVLLQLPDQSMRCCAGGTFKTHGLLYDNTYDRSLYAPGNSNCTGPSGYQVTAPPWTTPIVLAEFVLRHVTQHCPLLPTAAVADCRGCRVPRCSYWQGHAACEPQRGRSAVALLRRPELQGTALTASSVSRPGAIVAIITVVPALTCWALCAQFSIDETLEFNDYYYNGGVVGADTASQQLKAINPVNLPYRWANDFFTAPALTTLGSPHVQTFKATLTLILGPCRTTDLAPDRIRRVALRVGCVGCLVNRRTPLPCLRVKVDSWAVHHTLLSSLGLQAHPLSAQSWRLCTPSVSRPHLRCT